MSNLYKRLKAWAPLLTLGNTSSRRKELEKYSRYLVLNNIKNANILDYLRLPRSLEAIVNHFDWQYPSKYVDDFLKVLLKDQVIKRVKNDYMFKHSLKIENPEVKFIEDFNEVFETYATGIPDRLKG